VGDEGNTPTHTGTTERMKRGNGRIFWVLWRASPEKNTIKILRKRKREEFLREKVKKRDEEERRPNFLRNFLVEYGPHKKKEISEEKAEIISEI